MCSFTLTTGLLSALLLIHGSDGFFNAYPRMDSVAPERGDCGEPLMLTPLIAAGKIKEAQGRAQVRYSDFGNVKSYAGYLTINETHGSNSFFWYFPSEGDAADPVVLWLQGGPGASSLFGLFSENGPFEKRRRHWKKRPYSWNSKHHMIYIDNPVGTGFSFTKDGFADNETAVGADLREALGQFFALFPDLQKNEFFVTGESYAGKYVPALCRAIHSGNPSAKAPINLKGFAIGNGLSDPVNQLGYGPYFYQLGLIDRSGLKQFVDYETRGIAHIKAGEWLKAYEVFDTLLNGDEAPNGSLFFNLTGFKYYFNYLRSKDDLHSSDFVELFKIPQFRKALHVGNLTFNGGADVMQHLRLDMMQSVAGWVSELLSHYRAVIYNGQLDVIVPYPLTVNYLQSMNFTGAAEYRNATRHQWLVDGEIAGYAKTGGNLTEVIVRDAGHTVPADQPKWALDLLDRLTAGKAFF